MLGLLATARGQGRLEGFTINMTSLDDIFLEVTGGGSLGSLETTLGEMEKHHPGEELEGQYNPVEEQGQVEGSPKMGAVYRRPDSVETERHEDTGGEDPQV